MCVKKIGSILMFHSLLCYIVGMSCFFFIPRVQPVLYGNFIYKILFVWSHIDHETYLCHLQKKNRALTCVESSEVQTSFEQRQH